MTQSQPQYRPQILRHVPVPMRDGVRLSAHVTLPDTPGKYPAILEYTPYHKGIYPEPSPRYRYFAERGYAVVQVDIRGTGDSEGFTNTFSDPQQIHDGVEVVEWIARQSWCDGNVGMSGVSYVGFVCWQVAMHNPKPLKAIISYHNMVDLYTSYACPGGSPRPFPYQQSAPLMTGYNAAPPNPEIVGANWAAMWADRLEHGEPWGLAHVANLLDGPFWRDRSLPPGYDRITAATFLITGWADWYPDDFLRTFAKLNCPKRVLIGPWSHTYPADAPLPRVDDVRENLRWWDQWLKGIDSGLRQEPPITLFIQEFSPPDVTRLEEKGFFRSETDWPLARAKNTEFHLQADGVLGACSKTSGTGVSPVQSSPLSERTGETPVPLSAASDRDPLTYDPAVGVASGRYVIGQFWPIWGMPLDQRLDEPHSLVYTSEPLAAETEVTGHPRAVLHVSSTADVAYFSVKLCDVAPDGTSVLVSKGGLNATHRESHTHPTSLEPGKVYELAFDLQAIAYRFLAGHRIRVMIASADFQNAWPTPKPATNTIHRSASHPSRVILPIIPAQQPALPKPNLVIVEGPTPKREELPTPTDMSITHDLVRGTTTNSYRHSAGAGINQAKFTVSTANPARAVVDAIFEMHKQLPGMDVFIRTACLTASDEQAFHHTVQLWITVNDHPHFQKSWSVSVPRPLC